MFFFIIQLSFSFVNSKFRHYVAKFNLHLKEEVFFCFFDKKFNEIFGLEVESKYLTKNDLNEYLNFKIGLKNPI